jgi:hypothetical protein
MIDNPYLQCTDLPESFQFLALTDYGNSSDQCANNLNIVTSPASTPFSEFSCFDSGGTQNNGVVCLNNNFTSPDPVYQLAFSIQSTNSIENCHVNVTVIIQQPSNSSAFQASTCQSCFDQFTTCFDSCSGNDDACICKCIGNGLGCMPYDTCVQYSAMVNLWNKFQCP